MRRLLFRIRKGVIWVICRLFPVTQNKIVVSSYYGRGYGDNAKYIVEELLKQDKPVEVVWLVKNRQEQATLPDRVKGCIVDSFAGIYHLATAKVWLDNCRKWRTPFKRESQFYIQTWHGGGGQKKCEKDVEEILTKDYVRAAKADAKMTDLMISDGRFMTELYHRSFWYDGPVYECGYPRYDILLSRDKELRQKVYRYFGVDETKEFVLYAPTFRVDKSFDAYNVDFERLLNNLRNRFGKDFVALVHLHPNVAEQEDGVVYDGVNVINATFYPDMQELIAVSSVLIGDYSSVNYEFSLKKQPVFRYVADLDAYKNDRDFYFSFEEYPHPYAQNNDELEKLILDFDNDEYVDGVEKFLSKIGAVTEPGAAARAAGLILDYFDGSDKKAVLERKNCFYAHGKADDGQMSKPKSDCVKDV